MSRHDRLELLNKLRAKVPYVSQSALSSILAIAKEEQLPLDSRRVDIRAARDQLTSTLTPYGKIHTPVQLELLRGRSVTLEMQHPLAMLWYMTRTSACFSAMVERTFDTRTPTVGCPWGMVLYNDEVTPGNQLRQKHPRKLEGFYWSVLEFGPPVLSDEEGWLEACTVLSSTRTN